MQTVDLLVHNIGHLITCAGSLEPKRGAALRNLGIQSGAAVAVNGSTIEAVGRSGEMVERYSARRSIDAGGGAVIPGFVDCHTHVVYGGDRIDEFEMRIAGATYMEILAAGGGILSTMRHTRASTLDELVAAAARRLDTMLSLGSTTVEVKSGYGLSIDAELKMLRAIERLDKSHACRLVPTFLGAHTVPPAYTDDVEGYVELVIREMIPAVWSWYDGSHFAREGTSLFIDVFCEDHAFSPDQARRILEAGKEVGMQAKIHVDQFNSLGGLGMALDVGVTSVDHLEATVDDDIPHLANSQAIAVLMPAVNFNLGLTTFAPGRALIDGGAAVALATDMNPGSAPCFSIPLTMAIASRYLGLTPAEALNGGTINAAHALGLGDRIGSIEPGKSADLLILEDGDYRNLTYTLGANPVKTVIARGAVAHSAPE